MSSVTAASPRSTFSYFKTSSIVAVIALVAAFAFGYAQGGLTQAISDASLAGILAVLEVSLSFDNAVVNATVLRNWDAAWRRAFLMGGILVAVVGMRLLFPILIVSLTGGMGMGEVVNMAFNHPAQYAEALASKHFLVAAFGGVFLLMIALDFFLDIEKDEHWLEPIERRLTSLGQMKAIEGGIAFLVLAVVSRFLPAPEQLGFVLAGIMGFVTYVASKGLGTILGGEGAEKIVKASILGFLYLELLDASFSFDGVIGAFAITTSLPIIMIGLGIGAFFVRSTTIWLVETDKLAEYRYLEHGAFYAILVLSAIMMISPVVEIPEVVTGFGSAALIALAVFASIQANRRDAKVAA